MLSSRPQCAPQDPDEPPEHEVHHSPRPAAKGFANYLSCCQRSIASHSSEPDRAASAFIAKTVVKLDPAAARDRARRGARATPESMLDGWSRFAATRSRSDVLNALASPANKLSRIHEGNLRGQTSGPSLA
jgi:hypothetical protein